MRPVTPLVAVGTGLTTGLVVAVLVIELLAFEFSAIVALPVGGLAGLVALVATLAGFESATRGLRSLSVALAGFGYTVLLGMALRYVGFLGLRSVVTVPRILVVALVVAVATGAVALRGDDSHAADVGPGNRGPG